MFHLRIKGEMRFLFHSTRSKRTCKTTAYQLTDSNILITETGQGISSCVTFTLTIVTVSDIMFLTAMCIPF